MVVRIIAVVVGIAAVFFIARLLTNFIYTFLPPLSEGVHVIVQALILIASTLIVIEVIPRIEKRMRGKT